MASVVDTVNCAYTWQVANATAKMGYKITANHSCLLTKITKEATHTSTIAYLYASDHTTLLQSASFSGNDATFNYWLSSGQTYYVVSDNAGNIYTGRTDSHTDSEIDINITWVIGILDLGPPTEDSGDGYNILSVTTEDTVITGYGKIRASP